MNTSTISEYRKLRFQSIDDCEEEVQRIVRADREGRLQANGNWTAGQILAHLSAWIEYAYEGYPLKSPPFFIRWVLRLRLKKMLEKGMPRGTRIPGIKNGTTGMDDMPTSAAADRFLAALARLSSTEETKFDSPAFGALSQEDRIRLNLRHAELHLGYLNY
jgi:hypothetical protein